MRRVLDSGASGCSTNSFVNVLIARSIAACNGHRDQASSPSSFPKPRIATARTRWGTPLASAEGADLGIVPMWVPNPRALQGNLSRQVGTICRRGWVAPAVPDEIDDGAPEERSTEVLDAVHTKGLLTLASVRSRR